MLYNLEKMYCLSQYVSDIFIQKLELNATHLLKVLFIMAISSHHTPKQAQKKNEHLFLLL